MCQYGIYFYYSQQSQLLFCGDSPFLKCGYICWAILLHNILPLNVVVPVMLSGLSLTVDQVHLYSRSVCSHYRVSLACGHSCHHTEEVSELAFLNLLLPESIHTTPLARNFLGVWWYCHFCGLSSKVNGIFQRITQAKNRIVLYLSYKNVANYLVFWNNGIIIIYLVFWNNGNFFSYMKKMIHVDNILIYCTNHCCNTLCL